MSPCHRGVGPACLCKTVFEDRTDQCSFLHMLRHDNGEYMQYFIIIFHYDDLTKVEPCLAFWVAVGVCLGADSGTVESRKKAHTLEQNGGYLMGKNPLRRGIFFPSV